MSNDLFIDEEQNLMKVYAQRATVVYSLLFPVLLWFSGLADLLADSPSILTNAAIAYVCLNLCIPLSMPIALYFIWSRYLRKNYKSCHRCCFIPLYVFGFAKILVMFLDFPR